MRTSLVLVLSLAVGTVAGFSCGGTTPACNSSTCPQGCCDARGQCQPPSQNTCGQSGFACQTCQIGQICNLGVCLTLGCRHRLG